MIKNEIESEMKQWLSNIKFGVLLTYGCNYSCRHCLCLSNNGSINFDLAVSFLNDIKNWDYTKDRKVFFSGGELITYPKFFELSSLASNIKLNFGIVSNGTTVCYDNGKWLKESTPSIAISVDGKPDFHDYLRNKRGAFEIADRAIDILLENKCDVAIISSLLKKNIDHVNWLVEYCLRKGVYNIRFQPVTPKGNAIKFFKNSEFLSDIEVNDLLLQLLKVNGKNVGRLNTYSNVQFRNLCKEHPCQVGACHGGKCHSNSSPYPRRIILTPEGFLKPHSEDIDDKYTIGYYQKGKLKKILSDYFMSEKHKMYLNLLKHIYNTKVADPANTDKLVFNFEKTVCDESKRSMDQLESEIKNG